MPPSRIRNTDDSRLPDLDDEGRVPASDCKVVSVQLMLPAGTTNEEATALLERLYVREPTVLHWATNMLTSPRSSPRA